MLFDYQCKDAILIHPFSFEHWHGRVSLRFGHTGEVEIQHGIHNFWPDGYDKEVVIRTPPRCLYDPLTYKKFSGRDLVVEHLKIFN